MTVIAYKDNVMACDSCWSNNGVVVNLADKIIRLSSGGLLGEAGDSDTREIIALLDKVKKPAQLPAREQIAKLGIDYEALLVLPDGQIWNVFADIDKKDYGVYRVRRPFIAVGGGKEVAIGSMAAGASAPTAAAIACQWVTTCRGPIHQARLLPRAARRQSTK